MPAVVILTARFGHGHLSAAENICLALAQTRPDLTVEVVDPFQLTNPRTYRFLQWLYQFVSNHAPWAWHAFFRIMNRTQQSERTVRRNRELAKFFRTFAEHYRPAVVVSTYPVYASALRHFYGDADRCPFRLITVITDSVTINQAWVRGNSDRYLVAEPLTALALGKLGVPLDNITITGFPTPPHFVEMAGRDRRNDSTLGERKLTILYLPNLGTKNLFRILRILGVRADLKVILALGHRHKLVKKVKKSAGRFRCELEVLGWVPGICNRMFEADMVITKAGGATVHEALAAGCPVVISQVTPGQEEGNAHFIESMGVGIVVRDVRGLSKLLKFFQQVDYTVLADLRSNVEKIRRLDAPFRIAEIIAGEVQPSPQKNHQT